MQRYSISRLNLELNPQIYDSIAFVHLKTAEIWLSTRH